ncbi:MAG: hypothetical protein R2712_23780 [Vicinamibacterales bacterium]
MLVVGRYSYPLAGRRERNLGPLPVGLAQQPRRCPHLADEQSPQASGMGHVVIGRARDLGERPQDPAVPVEDPKRVLSSSGDPDETLGNHRDVGAPREQAADEGLLRDIGWCLDADGAGIGASLLPARLLFSAECLPTRIDPARTAAHARASKNRHSGNAP